jgi:hypothetical protein
MTKREFVDALVEVALDGVVTGEVGAMLDPPGRRPSLDLEARSDWFRGLGDDDRSMVVEVIRAAGYGVLHGVLCVLDGVAAIEDGPTKGTLTLIHERDGIVTDLTSSTAEPDLHDLLAEHR